MLKNDILARAACKLQFHCPFSADITRRIEDDCKADIGIPFHLFDNGQSAARLFMQNYRLAPHIAESFRHLALDDTVVTMNNKHSFSGDGFWFILCRHQGGLGSRHFGARNALAL